MTGMLKIILEIWDQYGAGVGCEVQLFPKTHQKKKKNLHVEQFSQNIYRMLTEDLTLLKKGKKTST